jgi:uncharacterized glyoxalase superfamily protein PhnB
MAVASVQAQNVTQAIPFFGITNMEASLRFYANGLGFAMTNSWVPDHDDHYPTDQKIRWCRLELGDAAIMLQEFPPQGQPKEALGKGVTVCFQCEDALALYRGFRARGIQTKRPFVGNGLWVVPVLDPDGYRLEFNSPTDAAEESELEE